MKFADLADFAKVDCDVYKTDASALHSVYKMKNGDPCMECGCNSDKDCPGYLMLKSKSIVRENKPAPEKTNAQIAKEITEKTGITYTARQVSKLRAKGELYKMLIELS